MEKEKSKVPIPLEEIEKLKAIKADIVKGKKIVLK